MCIVEMRFFERHWVDIGVGRPCGGMRWDVKVCSFAFLLAKFCNALINLLETMSRRKFDNRQHHKTVISMRWPVMCDFPSRLSRRFAEESEQVQSWNESLLPGTCSWAFF